MATKLAEVLLKSNKKDALKLAKLYAEMPEEYRKVTSKIYEVFNAASIRNMGELSAAELAIKLVNWIVENKALA